MTENSDTPRHELFDYLTAVSGSANGVAYAAGNPNVMAWYQVITPDLARHILTNFNEMNRSKRLKSIDTYTDAMNDDDWDSLNGDTITIDNNSQLVDGQHRLRAIEASGTAYECLIVYGTDPVSRTTKDDGTKRAFRDDLAMNGISGSNIKDALTRRIHAWDTNGGLASRTLRPRRKQLSRVYNINATEISRAFEGAHRFHTRWPSNRNSLYFMYWLLTERTGCDPDLVNRFFSIITIGSQEDTDQILVRLKAHITKVAYINPNGMNQYMSVQDEVYWLIRGWNYWVKGENLKRPFNQPINGITDPYPLPVQVTKASQPVVPEVIV